MSDGTTRRRRRVNPFVQIDRAVVRADTMSYRALGVLTFVLDVPPGKKIDVYTLSAPEGREGREAVATVLRELAAHGHYRVERRKLRDGRFAPGTSWSEIPVPHWIRDYQDYGGKPVPLIQQPDGSFLVRRPDKSLVPEDYDGDSEWEDDDPAPDPDKPTDPDVPAGQTANGFPGTGKPPAGKPPAGKPSPKEVDGLEDSKKKDQNLPAAQSASASSVGQQPASSRGATGTGGRRKRETFPPSTLITARTSDSAEWSGKLGDYPIERLPQDVPVPAVLVGRAAHHLTARFTAWWKAAAGLPEGELIDAAEGRNVIALQNEFVAAELAIGRTPLQVREALAACAQARPGVFLPDKGLWRAKLTTARKGRDPGTAARGLRDQQRPGRAHSGTPVVDRSDPGHAARVSYHWYDPDTDTEHGQAAAS